MDKKTLLLRFWQYQKERFPLIPNAVLITVFTFSAVVFSVYSRGGEGFVKPALFLRGTVNVFLFFFLLRILDEFKDAEDDKKYRPYRPVPRGLITFKELNCLAWAAILLQLVLNAMDNTRMITVYLIVLGYMLLMRVEFFSPAYLKKHPILYLLSHMIIMPLIAFYASGLDWIAGGQTPSAAMIIFYLLTFSNGIVIEIGRKIRRPEEEEAGVVTYSVLWGMQNAIRIWSLILIVTFITALIAAYYTGNFITALPFLAVLLLVAIKSTSGLQQPEPQKIGLSLETAAGLWTLGVYLIVGIFPPLSNFLGGIL